MTAEELYKHKGLTAVQETPTAGTQDQWKQHYKKRCSIVGTPITAERLEMLETTGAGSTSTSVVREATAEY